MRKYLLLFFLTLVSLCIGAQQKKAAFVYRNDNALNAFACNSIDSITYEINDEREDQVIWTADKVYRIPLESIDSVCFDTPKNVIFQIPEEDLNGWEVGYCLGDEYIVAYTDDSDSTIVLMVNKVGADEKNGLIMCLNESYEIIRVGNMDRIYDVRYEGDTMVLYRFNDEGLYEETVIPIPNYIREHNAPRKAPSLSSVYEIINNIVEYVGYIQSGVSIGTDVMKEDWKGAAAEVGWILVGFSVKDNIVLGYLQAAIDHYLNQDAERKRAVLYNNCEIEIDEVKSDNGDRVVYATVKNANNLPDYLFRAFYDHEFNDQTRNLVSCGIVVRKGKKNVTTHRYDFKSQLTPLNGDGAAGAEIYLSFTIPEFSDAPNFKTYYLRPYLTSTRLKSGSGDVSENYIKYGETYEYTCPIVVIDNITKKSCKQYESSSLYFVEVSVDASIEDLKDVTEWGVAFYSSANAGELLKEVTITSGKPAYLFQYQDYLDESYFDKQLKCIKLRAVPFAKGRSNSDRTYGKAKDFEAKLSETSCPDSNHPHMIDLGIGTKWACCNVGAHSPEEYGGYYAWGEVSEKSVYNDVTYKYATGVDKDGDGYYDDYHSDTDVYGIWQSLGSDISGTGYDVAHVQWGGSWCMPTVDEIKALVDNCSSVWTTENGVYGRRFTGPSGGSIFLPAAGYRWGGGLYSAGEDGHYWSSTQRPLDSYDAYGLYFDSGGADWSYYYRGGGRSVRPVVRN